MRKLLFLALSSILSTACFPEPPVRGDDDPDPPSTGPDAGSDTPCTRSSADASQSEGYPFDVGTFDAQILPELQASCTSGSGCHGPGNSNNLTVYLDADSSCAGVETFNEVFRLSDYQSGSTASPIVTAINGTLTSHPVQPPAADALVSALESYIDAAKQTYEQGGGGGGGSPAGAFDLDTFTNQIQPILDNANCMATGCHDIDGGNLGGDFGLHPGARPSAAQIQENLEAVVERIDTSLPPAQATQAVFYQKAAVDRHGGSVVGNAQAVEDWIAEGLTALSSGE